MLSFLESHIRFMAWRVSRCGGCRPGCTRDEAAPPAPLGAPTVVFTGRGSRKRPSVGPGREGGGAPVHQHAQLLKARVHDQGTPGQLHHNAGGPLIRTSAPAGLAPGFCGLGSSWQALKLSIPTANSGPGIIECMKSESGSKPVSADTEARETS